MTLPTPCVAPHALPPQGSVHNWRIICPEEGLIFLLTSTNFRSTHFFSKAEEKRAQPRGICEFWGTLHSVPGYKCLLKSHHLLRYLKAWLEASVLLLYVKFPHRVGQAPSHSDLMTYFLIKIISVLSKAWGLKMLPSSMPGTVHMVKTHSQGGHRTKENIFILFF